MKGQQEHGQLRCLLMDYDSAVQLGQRLDDDSTEDDLNVYASLLASLQQRSLLLLGIKEQDAAEDLECECGSTLVSLIQFFGQTIDIHIWSNVQVAMSRHCMWETTGNDALNPACSHHAGVDAEGNHTVNGSVVSNHGRTMEQLRDEYFATL